MSNFTKMALQQISDEIPTKSPGDFSSDTREVSYPPYKCFSSGVGASHCINLLGSRVHAMNLDPKNWTDKTQEAFVAAQDLAREQSNPQVYPVHIALALFVDPEVCAIQRRIFEE